VKDKVIGKLDKFKGKLKGGFKDIKNIFEPFTGEKDDVAGM